VALTEAQIRRYSRHILLPDVGGTGQSRLLAATVAIDLSIDTPAAIAAATYLAAAGIGTLVLTGPGAVSETDLAAGIALGRADLGRPLADAVADRLRALNPDVRISDTPEKGAWHFGTGAGEVGETVADALVRAGREACRIVYAIATGAA